jgi:hypothetical protein
VLQGYDRYTGNVLAFHVRVHNAIDPRPHRGLGVDRKRQSEAAEDDECAEHAEARVLHRRPLRRAEQVGVRLVFSDYAECTSLSFGCVRVMRLSDSTDCGTAM